MKNKKRSNCIEEINITPLVDVFLVLLSIFVVLSMMYYNMSNTIINEISVPKTSQSTKTKIKRYEYTNVFINKNLTIKIDNKKAVSFKLFEKNIKLLALKKIIIIADKDIQYKYIIKVMDIFKNNGIEDISIELSSI